MALKFFPLTIFFGGAAAVATAITAPQFVGAPLTFMGGVLAGVSIADKKLSALAKVPILLTELAGLSVLCMKKIVV